MLSARLDAELLVAEIRRRELDEFKQSAGQVFDALIARGGGFRDFLRGQALTVGRTVFQNVAGEVFNSSRGRLELPGQTTKDDDGNPKLTALGRILQGTPFGVDPGKVALELNTTALQKLTTAASNDPAKFSRDANTNALDRLTVAVSKAQASALLPSGGGGGLLGDFPLGRDIEKFLDFGKISGLTEINEFPLGRDIDKFLNLGKIPGLKDIGKSADASKDAANASKEVSKGLGKIFELGVPLGVGGFGIASGIRQGGAGGKLSIAGGALTAASAIPGPQQPFVAAAGQVLSLVGSLIGDSKQNRQEEIQAELERRRFEAPESREREFSGGFETDLNFYRGAPRIVNLNLNPVVNINAIDSKSFSDHRQAIAGAVNDAVIEGTDLVHTFQERFLPA
jgi:hypothetical protein